MLNFTTLTREITSLVSSVTKNAVVTYLKQSQKPYKGSQQVSK